MAAILAAQLVVVVHLTYLVFVLLGGFLGLRRAAWLGPHLASVVWGVYGVFAQAQCPLTSLQKWLLTLGGLEPYDGPFIDTYVAGVFYPTAWQDLVWLLSAGVVLASYVLVLARYSGQRGRAAAH